MAITSFIVFCSKLKKSISFACRGGNKNKTGCYQIRANCGLAVTASCLVFWAQTNLNENDVSGGGGVIGVFVRSFAFTSKHCFLLNMLPRNKIKAKTDRPGLAELFFLLN